MVKSGTGDRASHLLSLPYRLLSLSVSRLGGRLAAPSSVCSYNGGRFGIAVMMARMAASSTSSLSGGLPTSPRACSSRSRCSWRSSLMSPPVCSATWPPSPTLASMSSSWSSPWARCLGDLGHERQVARVQPREHRCVWEGRRRNAKVGAREGAMARQLGSPI
jgi:hypothetical protein